MSAISSALAPIATRQRAEEIDRESARELLAAKMGVPDPSATAPAGRAEPKAKPTMATGTKKAGTKIVDVKFVDTFGTWQHFSVPVGELTAEVFEEGCGKGADGRGCVLELRV